MNDKIKIELDNIMNIASSRDLSVDDLKSIFAEAIARLETEEEIVEQNNLIRTPEAYEPDTPSELTEDNIYNAAAIPKEVLDDNAELFQPQTPINSSEFGTLESETSFFGE